MVLLSYDMEAVFAGDDAHASAVIKVAVDRTHIVYKSNRAHSAGFNGTGIVPHAVKLDARSLGVMLF